ncbi:MAG: hypothetical protein ACE5K2_05860 [Candidatus Zixiibacteriota bacterium]
MPGEPGKSKTGMSSPQLNNQLPGMFYYSGRNINYPISDRLHNFKLIQIFNNRIILQKDHKTIEMFLGKSHKFGSIKMNEEKRLALNSEQNQSSFSVKGGKSGSDKYLTRIELVRSDVMTRITSEWPLIIKETKLSPNLVQGKISGFKITNLPQKSILSNIGIYNNDIIKEVNGTKLDDMKTIFRLYNELRNEDEIEVKIERKGKPFYILYTIK